MIRKNETVNIEPQDLKDFRDKFDLTQDDLGALMEVSSVTVYNWESGDNKPGSKYVERFQELKEKSVSGVHAKLARTTDRCSGEDIKKLRERLDMSQGEFAEKLGVSTGTVSNWEREVNSPGETAIEKMRELKRS